MFRGSTAPVIRDHPIAPHPSLLSLISIRIEDDRTEHFDTGRQRQPTSSRFASSRLAWTQASCPRASGSLGLCILWNSACAAASQGLRSAQKCQCSYIYPAAPAPGHASPPASACQNAVRCCGRARTRCWSRARASSWGQIGRPLPAPCAVRCGEGGCGMGRS